MRLTNYRTLAACLLVGILLLVSWLKPLDEVTDDYLSDSIKTGVIIYGISRAINAAVSVIQSAEVSVAIASFAPGQALDPLNDLVERFSEVMTVSLTSLALQKVLAEIAGKQVFNTLLTLAAFAFVISILLTRYQAHATYRILAFRLFAAIVVVRFFIPVMVLANSAVDRLFVDPEVQLETQHLKGIQKAVDSISMAGFDTERGELKQRLAALQRRKADLVGEVQQLKENIATLESSKPARSWWLPEFVTKDPARKKINREIKMLRTMLDGRRGAIEKIDAQKRAIEEKLECLDKKAHGESCSWFEKLKGTGNIIRLPEIDFDQTLNSVIKLMALVVLRSIALPLAFWFLLYRAIKVIWRWGKWLKGATAVAVGGA